MKLRKRIKQYDWKNYIIYYSFYGIMIAIILWMILSYLNIIAHNSAGDMTYEYWKYNLWTLLFDRRG